MIGIKRKSELGIMDTIEKGIMTTNLKIGNYRYKEKKRTRNYGYN